MKTAICAVIKNEQRYLKEWIDHHISIGFDHIYLFEDYGSQSHHSITDEYENVTLSTLAYFGIPADVYQNGKACKRQYNLYNKAIQHFKGECDWMALIDIDEFITLDEGIDLHTMLAEFNDKRGLYLYWKNMSANGHIKYENLPVQQRFTQEVPMLPEDKGWMFKSIVNLNVNSLPMVSVHQGDGFVNTKGFQMSMCACYYRAHIKHYFTKSWEEWCERFLTRGSLQWGHRHPEQFFTVNTDLLPQKNKLLKSLNTKMRKMHPASEIIS